MCIIAVHVDDLVRACNCAKRLAEEKEKLGARFEMTDWGELTYILGIVVKRDSANHTLSLTQNR